MKLNFFPPSFLYLNETDDTNLVQKRNSIIAFGMGIYIFIYGDLMWYFGT